MSKARILWLWFSCLYMCCSQTIRLNVFLSPLPSPRGFFFTCNPDPGAEVLDYQPCDESVVNGGVNCAMQGVDYAIGDDVYCSNPSVTLIRGTTYDFSVTGGSTFYIRPVNKSGSTQTNMGPADGMLSIVGGTQNGVITYRPLLTENRTVFYASDLSTFRVIAFILINSTCDPSPCQHGGTCTLPIFEDQTLSQTNYSCSCTPGYVDVNCSSRVNMCDDDPCTHGVCTNGMNSYICTCPPEYTGIGCEIPLQSSSSSSSGLSSSNSNSDSSSGPGGSSSTDSSSGSVSPSSTGSNSTSMDEYCNFHGVNTTNGQCECNAFYSGNQCEIECSSHGMIIDSACVCYSPIHTGPTCSIVCNGFGLLVGGHCVCEENRIGIYCELDEQEDPRCSHHGRYSQGLCLCNEDSIGSSCELNAHPDEVCAHGQQLYSPH